ncbi:MET27 protein, partial [Atractosteus spatula]|nr:MET27 protein [Atractosteus spatula]
MAVPGDAIGNLKKINSLQGLEERLEFYKTWAPHHEKDIQPMEYRAPYFLAETVAGLFEEGQQGDQRGWLLVLDAACGTGLVADEMFKFGFRQFHGVDACLPMMEVAERKGRYQKLIHGLLGNGTASLESSVYDIVVAVGAFQGGGVPWSAVPELLGALKPGGVLCFTLRGDSADFRQRSLSELQDFLDQGLLEQVTERHIPKFQRPIWEESPEEEYIPGIVCVFRKSL